MLIFNTRFDFLVSMLGVVDTHKVIAKCELLFYATRARAFFTGA
jgi:hypothetical protein